MFRMFASKIVGQKRFSPLEITIFLVLHVAKHKKSGCQACDYSITRLFIP